MKILYSRTFRGVTTDLYTNGSFTCSCPEFRQIGSGHCEHTKELIKEQVTAKETEKEEESK